MNAQEWTVLVFLIGIIVVSAIRIVWNRVQERKRAQRDVEVVARAARRAQAVTSDLIFMKQIAELDRIFERNKILRSRQEAHRRALTRGRRRRPANSPRWIRK